MYNVRYQPFQSGSVAPLNGLRALHLCSRTSSRQLPGTHSPNQSLTPQVLRRVPLLLSVIFNFTAPILTLSRHNIHHGNQWGRPLVPPANSTRRRRIYKLHISHHGPRGSAWLYALTSLRPCNFCRELVETLAPVLCPPTYYKRRHEL